MSNDFDVVIIGGGPGGYVCAIKASQLGLKVACVEKRGALGGTCLNVGCIPSKALLHSSYLYHLAHEEFATHGIEASSIKLNINKMLENKDKIVKGLTGGIEMLFKKNKVTYIKGEASFTDKNQIEVKSQDGKIEKIKAKNFVIATGSVITELPNVKIDGKKIVNSDHAISLPKVPKKLIVIGAGVIGLELGSVWSRLGAEVTVIEYLDKILPPMDNEISKAAQKIFEKQGIKFKLNSKVVSATAEKNGAKTEIEDNKSGKKESMDADIVLVAIGRRANTENLNLEAAGVKLDDRKRIDVNGKFKTNIDNIYAIGDVIKGPMLAHKAEEDGVAVAENLVGQAGHVDYNIMPSVVYTHPEIASIGKNEEQLKADNIEYNIGKFPFIANSRARAVNDTEGFVKILADKKTDEVLGAHIIGPQAGTIINELSVAMAYRASSEDIARICHSHPDLNEAVKEAAMAAYSKPIHM